MPDMPHCVSGITGDISGIYYYRQPFGADPECYFLAVIGGSVEYEVIGGGSLYHVYLVVVYYDIVLCHIISSPPSSSFDLRYSLVPSIRSFRKNKLPFHYPYLEYNPV